MSREDSQLIPNTNALFRHEAAPVVRELHGAWQGATPPLHSGQTMAHSVRHDLLLIVLITSPPKLAE